MAVQLKDDDSGQRATASSIMPIDLLHGKLTGAILTAFYEAYNTLLYVYVESVCSAALERELRAS